MINQKLVTLARAGIFVALYVIANQFVLAPNNFLEIGFSFLVFVAAGYNFNLWTAAQIGFVADILAYLTRPSGFFFLGFTLNSILCCLIYSYFFYQQKNITWQRVAFTLALTTFLISFILNPLWLYLMYGTNVYSWLRILKAIIKYPLDVFLAYRLLKLLNKPSS